MGPRGRRSSHLPWRAGRASAPARNAGNESKQSQAGSTPALGRASRYGGAVRPYNAAMSERRVDTDRDGAMARRSQCEDAYDAIVAAPFGALGVKMGRGAVREIAFLPPGTPPGLSRSPAAAAAFSALESYLRDPRSRFDLQLAPEGTPFQRRVWAAMQRIPVGETRTYGDLARELGSAPRAVGQACGANPLPVVVPCHRVVAASGLGGFAHRSEGFLLGVKRWLLAHEARAAAEPRSLFAHEAP